MIKAVIYDKVANTNTGQMQGEMRVVGYQYSLPGVEPDKKGEWPKVTVIKEETRRDQKVVVIYYSDGSTQTIPDRGIEKIESYV